MAKICLFQNGEFGSPTFGCHIGLVGMLGITFPPPP
ncbi:hypothetical protein CCACVL1_29985 [Corchorus capsularis]|uniref:Uncharacterized protein n=1 Tax=Corchorus capsularis TaxID=210143 RepID=A0A1R3FZ89_COCAP|nr:hypothetical protein CCACVL1_29985 [Corchorus capsularis]